MWEAARASGLYIVALMLGCFFVFVCFVLLFVCLFVHPYLQGHCFYIKVVSLEFLIFRDCL